MNSQHISKPLVWFSGEVKTPPFSTGARIEARLLLRRLQEGEILSLPVSRPMPSISAHCHELRINDNETDKQWRIIYRIDPDAIVIVDVFQKKTQKTPKRVINNSGLTQKLSQTLIPLCSLRPLRFVFWSFCVSPIIVKND